MVNIEDLTDIVLDKLLNFKFFENGWYDLSEDDQEKVYESLNEALSEWKDEECFNDDDLT
jgi:hypothetical protein